MTSGLNQTAKAKAGSPAAPRADTPRGPLFVGSVEKAFSVLKAFEIARIPLSLSEIATLTGLGKSAAQRFCHTLVELGFLDRDDSSRKMRPSPRLLGFSYSYLASDPISRVATPYLLQMRETCGHAVNLAMPLDQQVVYVVRLPSPRSFLFNPIVGARAPMFCTSSGRAYLSTQSDEQVTSILDASDLSPMTRHTITDRAQIQEKIEDARAVGFTTASQECAIGELTIGAPLFQKDGMGAGAINICVTTPTWSIERVIEELVPIISNTAHEISLGLANLPKAG